MKKHDSERIDRNGKQIRNVRERLPNGQKKRLRYNVTFGDWLKDEESREPLVEVILVESYKKYNLDVQYNDNGCCSIF